MTDWCTGIGEGWRPLVTRLVNLCEINNVGILQVKEKFGGLRFYVAVASNEVFQEIQRAEKESYTICEECGQPGEPRPLAWIKTLCVECWGKGNWTRENPESTEIENIIKELDKAI